MERKKKEFHGDTKTRLYGIWHDMRVRCYTPKCKLYKWYGAEGVTVCDDWNSSYIAFKEWALQSGYEPTLTIDRIETSKGYSPDNCRWSTNNTQRQNTRILKSTNTSGYRGVSWSKQKNKWHARIKQFDKFKHLGFYADILEGAKAYDKYILDNNLEHTPNGVL